MPEGVEAILDSSFSNAHLTEVHIPKSVDRIGMSAFMFCSYLKRAFFYGDAPSISAHAFEGVASDFKVIYYSNRKGFSNPWYGYPTEAQDPRLPDPIITDIQWSPQHPIQGDEIIFSVTIKNQDVPIHNAGPLKGGSSYYCFPLFCQKGVAYRYFRALHLD